MFKYCRSLGSILVICIAAALAAGCGGKKSPETQTPESVVSSKKADKINYQEFAPLPKATTAAELPYILGPEGEEQIPCFHTAQDIAPEDAGFEVRNLVKRNSSAVNKAIQRWFVRDLAPAGLSEVMASNWEIEIEDPVFLQVSKETVRFVDDQQCIQPDTGWLPRSMRAVTTLIGARTFNFKTKSPLDIHVQEEMIQAVGMENIIMESPALFVYEPVTDGNGQPVVDHEGQPLFKSPDGKHITEKDVPQPEQRKMKKWTLKAESPIYFAFRELPKDAWRKESKKNICDVFLVWGDVTPRVPECDEFKESSFVAQKAQGDGVEVSITTGSDNRVENMSYGDTQMMKLSDRIIIWLGLRKIEEGVLLRLNSLVLDPQPMGAGGRVAERPKYVPTRSAPVDEEKPPEMKRSKKQNKQKKQKERKQESPRSDVESLDDFLND
ncbi:MAG: hypothetical protein GY847_15130 [Proteobacteria bacterium]|nr:hypothetical protein [Pseudomonadota bacterium]